MNNAHRQRGMKRVACGWVRNMCLWERKREEEDEEGKRTKT
jgi:hypothetical protein